MRSATVSPAAKFSLAIPLALALSLFAVTGSAVAQDATKTESPTPAAKHSDSSSDRQQRRAERRQAEAAAKAESDAKSTDLAKFPKTDTAECRKQEVTGSRVGKNVCATPEQWAETDAAAAEAIRQMRSEASSKSGQTLQTSPYRNGSTL
jgi:hypothetical protein